MKYIQILPFSGAFGADTVGQVVSILPSDNDNVVNIRYPDGTVGGTSRETFDRLFTPVVKFDPENTGAVIALYDSPKGYYAMFNTRPYRLWPIDAERFFEWLKFMRPKPFIGDNVGDNVTYWVAKSPEEVLESV